MQAATHIHIKGAREHNLKNLELRLPRGKLIVVTGPSGSGKSSLAFDTLYAEGYRKYIESLSTQARQILDQLKRPDVDFIHGLSPVLAIEQRTGERRIEEQALPEARRGGIIRPRVADVRRRRRHRRERHQRRISCGRSARDQEQREDRGAAQRLTPSMI